MAARAGQSRAHSGKGKERVSVRTLRSKDWPVVERLFGANGACGGCWCMYWRLPQGGRLWEENKGDKNRRAMEKLVSGGRVHACLAFAGDDPAGWCCLGPRADFPRIERTKALATEWSPKTWSVVCFYIPARWRHRGVATALLKHAVSVARDHGAAELEGYPVRSTKSEVAEIPAAFAWTGIVPLFERCGFKKATDSGQSRDVYRRRFRAGAPKSRREPACD